MAASEGSGKCPNLDKAGRETGRQIPEQDTDEGRGRMVERGAEYGEKECHNGLGIIWRDGLVDGKKDLKKAFTHFMVAANQDLAEAQVNLGKLQYCQSSISIPILSCK